MTKKIHITETMLRDANQSQIATRLKREEFADILETMDQAGYHSMEVWGGATFDSCLRYLDEDPWERLRFIRSKVKNTKLQMLLRGQNVLGYSHYSDEFVTEFIKKSVENGIDIIRIFDALNDVRNIETAVKATVEAGGHAQGAICYTVSPIHTFESYVELAKKMVAMGCKSICIKDMAGIMTPQHAADLVKALKAEIDVPIYIHTHMTTGLGAMTYMAAVEAGADGIDCAISVFSGGTAQPPTETLVYTLNEMGYDCGVDSAVTKKINDFFKPIQEKYLSDGGLNPSVLSTKIDALVYQIPGGMLSNMISQLTAMKSLDRLDEVLAEVPEVRKDLGYPPLVTPMSQIVGAQSVSNVLSGKRYSNVSKETKAYLKGFYGQAPGEVNQELVQQVLGDEKPYVGRYADTLESELPAAREYLGKLARSEEDVLSYVAFPAQAEAYFELREEKEALHVSYSIERVD